jgi:hypothetical protein
VQNICSTSTLRPSIFKAASYLTFLIGLVVSRDLASWDAQLEELLSEFAKSPSKSRAVTRIAPKKRTSKYSKTEHPTTTKRKSGERAKPKAVSNGSATNIVQKSLARMSNCGGKRKNEARLEPKANRLHPMLRREEDRGAGPRALDVLMEDKHSDLTSDEGEARALISTMTNLATQRKAERLRRNVEITEHYKNEMLCIASKGEERLRNAADESVRRLNTKTRFCEKKLTDLERRLLAATKAGKVRHTFNVLANQVVNLCVHAKPCIAPASDLILGCCNFRG